MVLLWLLLACVPPAPVPASEGVVHTFEGLFASGAGCIPKGDLRTLTGRVEVSPFGKGSDGAKVVTDDEAWVVSYGVDDLLRSLHGHRVEATGRACDKQGGAVGGPHFDLARLVDLGRP